MSQYDPQASYDVNYQGRRVGELRQGRYFEGTWEVGYMEGEVFHYNGQVRGKREGLTLTRNDPPGELTQFDLVLQEPAQA